MTFAETHDEGDADPALDQHEADLDGLAEAWVFWCRSHRLYEPLPVAGAVLARRGGLTRPLPAAIDPAISAASLAAFHIAYTCQPDALDKQVFAIYYLARTRPIKTAAAALGIGKTQFYNVLQAFRQRVAVAARALEGQVTDARSSSASAYSLQILSSHVEATEVKTPSEEKRPL